MTEAKTRKKRMSRAFSDIPVDEGNRSSIIGSFGHLVRRIRPFHYLLLAYVIGYAIIPWSTIRSEEDLLDLPISNILLWSGTKDHVRMQYLGDKNMSNRERHAILSKLGESVVNTFTKLNLKPYLQTGSLLGYMRHKDKVLPWDDDVDIAIYSPDCEKIFPEAGKLHEEFSKIIDLNKYEITRPINCRGNFFMGNMRSLSGRVVDRISGFYVDLYAYVPVPERVVSTLPALPNPDDFWIQSDSDYHRAFYPSSYLFPLQKVPYADTSVYIPHKPLHALACEYGPNLDVPAFFWGIAAYTHVSLLSYVFAGFLGVICGNFGYQTASLIAVLLFGGSLRAMYLLAATLMFLYVQLGATTKATAATSPRRRLLLSLLALALVASLCVDIFFARRVLPYDFNIPDLIRVPPENHSDPRPNAPRAPEILF